MARPKPLTNPRPLGAVEFVRDADGAVTGYRRLDRQFPLPVIPFLPALKALENEFGSGPDARTSDSLEPFYS